MIPIIDSQFACFYDPLTKLPVLDPMVGEETGQLYSKKIVECADSFGWTLKLRAPTKAELKNLRCYEKTFTDAILASRISYYANFKPTNENALILKKWSEMRRDLVTRKDPLNISAYAVAAISVIFFAWWLTLLKGDFNETQS